MSDLPPFLAGFAGLDDDALVTLGNRGLLRRAGGLVASVTVVSSDAERVVVAVGDAPAPQVTLTAAGASAARCSCPVAGVCVHVMAAFLWTRGLGLASSPGPRAAEEPVTPDAAPAPDPEPTVLSPSQAEVVRLVRETLEDLVALGLSHLEPRAGEALTSLGQRVHLEGLPRLARALQRAGGAVNALVARRTEADEGTALDALARAWALTTALASDPTPELIGHRDGTPTATGVLVPLSVRWWHGPDGSRGVTGCFWDADHRRLEWATTGRAAGQDPSFQKSPTLPLLWGAGAHDLMAGPFLLRDAERLPDGTLGTTSRTRWVPPEASDPAGVDLAALAHELTDAQTTAGAATFEAASPLVTLVLVAPGGSGPLGLDEVRQQVIWPVTDAAGRVHLLRMKPGGIEAEGLLRLFAQDVPVLAVTVEDGVPTTVFCRVDDEVKGLSLSFLPHLPWLTWQELQEKLTKLRRLPAVTRLEPDADPLTALTAELADALTALAASGRRSAGSQADRLARSEKKAEDLGLHVLARAVAGVRPDATPARVLRATAVVGRLRALLRG